MTGGGERHDDHGDHTNMAFYVTEGNGSDCWIMDCSAMAHMCKDKKAFADYTATTKVRNIQSAKNSASLKVLGQDTVILRVWNGKMWLNARLNNVLHVQDLSKNLFSLTAATARGMKIGIFGDGCVVKKCGRIVATGSRRGMLLQLNVEADEECHMFEHEAQLWHR